MELISFKDKSYPFFQCTGFAARFAIPYAQELCIGKGVDIGCNKPEWAFPGALLVDPTINKYNALDFPYDDLDYIFSSHCLEHLNDWVTVLDYWIGKLKKNGIVFLYLPHYDQEYWRPWNNRKHVNIFTTQILKDFFEDRLFQNIFYSERDLNHSFMFVAEKI